MEETITEKDIIIHELINDLATKNETISQMLQELENMKKALLTQKDLLGNSITTGELMDMTYPDAVRGMENRSQNSSFTL